MMTLSKVQKAWGLGAAIVATLFTGGLGLVGAYDGVWIKADGRYVHQVVYNDQAWAALKQTIRELRRRMAETDDDVERSYLEDDLELALDKLCRLEPDDRECI